MPPKATAGTVLPARRHRLRKRMIPKSRVVKDLSQMKAMHHDAAEAAGRKFAPPAALSSKVRNLRLRTLEFQIGGRDFAPAPSRF